MIYTLVFFCLVILSYLYYKVADKYNIIDKPNHRSSHTQITIRGGGIIFYFALVIYEISSGFDLAWLFLGVSLIAVLSFIDDIKPLPPSIRLPVQCVAAILVLLELNLNIHWTLLIVLFIISVGFINAFNFMDGINGITGIYSLVILIFTYIFNTLFVSFVSGDLILFLIFSVVIFGFYNFRVKALFFAGDVGSITMAVCVLFLVLAIFQKTNAVSVLLIVAVYGVDSVLTIVRRIIMKEKITEAHRHHLYQHLVDTEKFTHLQTALIYGGLQSISFVIFLLIFKLSFVTQLLITTVGLLFLAGLYFLFIKKFKNYNSISN